LDCRIRAGDAQRLAAELSFTPETIARGSKTSTFNSIISRLAIPASMKRRRPAPPVHRHALQVTLRLLQSVAYSLRFLEEIRGH
jgi:hypothetical protein